ncbi:uncharacterized protein LOC6573511 isoform X2 [Drosophila mojavensis]|uniref:uncharacterized protein LOC6573511 isoform X2 n=1 Tax=Drosophila mojavensis TaxID=7230 RepID=UPI001CD11D50|nr:uncharacterized protein LOC6573511 isoform X2 [Drosophila mojavensis]
MQECQEAAATAASDTATAETTTAGAEALSGSASGSDAADTGSEERNRCHTGGLQQERLQNRSKPPNWRQSFNNIKHFNNNNWNPYIQNPNHFYPRNSSRGLCRNFRQDRQFWHPSLNYLGDNNNNWNQPSERRDFRRGSSYRGNGGYYRNSSTNRSNTFAGDSTGRKWEPTNNGYSNFISCKRSQSQEPSHETQPQAGAEEEELCSKSEEIQLNEQSGESISKSENIINDSTAEKPIESAKEQTVSKFRKQSQNNSRISKTVEQLDQIKNQNKPRVRFERKNGQNNITIQLKSTETKREESNSKREQTKENEKDLKDSEKQVNPCPKKLNISNSHFKVRPVRNNIPSPVRRQNAARNNTNLVKAVEGKLSITEPKKSLGPHQAAAPSKPTESKQPGQGEAGSTANNTYPKIQVRPLAELLKQEIIAVTQEQRLETGTGTAGALSANPVKPGQRPTVQSRRRTVSNNNHNGGGDYSLNERLANMDKESLKNIINNSDTIYNEHLKLQARRRLREEIRRQLKEIELEQPKDTLTKDLIEDEIVESIKLPPFLLQEIGKCFGIDISVGATIETNASKDNKEPCSSSTIECEQAGRPNEVTNKDNAPTQEQSTEQTESQAMGSATDLMERLKVAEQFKMMAAKKCRNKQASEKPKPPSFQSKSAKICDSIQKPNPQRKETESSAPAQGKQQQQSKESIPVETVNPLSIKQEIQSPSKNTPKSCGIIVVVSSEDEDEGEHITVKQQSQQKKKKRIAAAVSDADSDHSSSSSCSTDSTKRRYQQKLESDANNIVDSFEKLILPQLKESLAERYRGSHCASLQSRLHFISCVVTSSEHNSQSFSKAEVAKIQQNLKSNDYREAIEFLLREIVNVVNLQKQTAMARRRQNLEKAMPNELIATSAAAKNAEPASESHQREAAGPAAAAAAQAQAVMPPTPPRNGTPTPTTVASVARPLHTLPTGLPYMGLDSTVARLSPGSFSPNDSIMLMGDSVTHGLLEIDRRLLENQNRRGFLEEMIMKFQREKSDLEMLSLELQNRKFLLLNTVISRNQTTTMPPLTTVTPTNSPLPAVPTTNPAPATEVAASAAAPAKSEVSPRKRKRRAVVVKRVKIVKRRRLVKRSTEPTPSHAADKKVASKGTETEPEPCIPQPITLQLNIKQEPIEAPKTPPPSTDSNPTVTGNSPQYQHLTRSDSASLAQQTMAVVPPLPPPPPPPEPFANMSQYDLPRMLLKPTAPLPTPCSAESQMAANLESYNYDYISTGRLHNINCPITQIRVYKAYIIAASENGDIFLFNIGTHKLEFQITKHSEAITNMYLCEKESYLYTTSLDGFFKKSSLENLERVMQTVYLKEPLQSIDIEWGVAFIGSRWGNIFTYNIAANKVMDLPLLATGQSVIAIKATKEGARNIIILGCKGNVVLLHDAATGLLLRRLSMPDGLNVYSLLLLDGHLFCGTQKNEVFKFDFATGLVTSTFTCGNGAVTMALYKENYLLIGCYDGYIYVLNKETGLQLGRFPGPGRLVLALALAGDKAIASSKDNALEILQIPPELLAYDQST